MSNGLSKCVHYYQSLLWNCLWKMSLRDDSSPDNTLWLLLPCPNNAITKPLVTSLWLWWRLQILSWSTEEATGRHFHLFLHYYTPYKMRERARWSIWFQRIKHQISTTSFEPLIFTHTWPHTLRLHHHDVKNLQPRGKGSRLLLCWAYRLLDQVPSLFYSQGSFSESLDFYSLKTSVSVTLPAESSENASRQNLRVLFQYLSPPVAVGI